MSALIARLNAPWPLRPRFALGRLLPILGPGYVVAVGYMDPGNWATDVAAGARYGFDLLSVVLVASLAAAFFQALVVRLTLATGKDLASLIRESFPRPAVLALWAVTEIALVATDLAELLGGAVALKLLFGLPIPLGVLASSAATFLMLLRAGSSGRLPERIIGALVLVLAFCLLVELSAVHADPGAALRGLAPRLDIVRDPEMLVLSLGILGATIMPHNLYLHAGLARAYATATATEAGRRAAARALSRDSALALAFAGLVNVAILVLAAAAFHGAAGNAEIGLEDAYRLLDPSLGGGLASLIFAVALLASGQSSAATGTMAAQFVTEGFLAIRVPAWLRALLTRCAALVPALLVPLAAGEGAASELVILSQVVLGLALPFVLVPMLLLMRRRGLMGPFAVPSGILGAAAALTLLLTILNTWLAGISLA